MTLTRRNALAALAVGASGIPALAAGRPSVRVEPITAELDCHVWVLLWGPWLLIECRNNFAQMRGRIAGALSESRRFVGGAARADYVLTGRVAELGLVTGSASESGYTMNTSRAVATLDFTLRAPGRDRALYTGTATGSVDVSSGIATDGGSFSSESSARATYAALQRETALAAARMVAFEVDPLRVVSVSGRRIILNYGAPLLDMGATVQVADTSGVPVTYRVTGSMTDTAVAEAAVDSSVAAGSRARFIERAASPGGVNRYPKVDLPD